ncbi:MULTISPECIES: non-ribosomal peptide synthetase [Streptomycetaceae]|uniref:N-(5-amino-5-carboxypentanoyl)-L-cysteinyl-D-valine synthase n=2 Tax=Streptantibioticus cattleyicolor TaxID=29303 RepID=F8JTW5_STREN|nr:MULTISPECIES: non-ribosomal peptide synthetase [Streptomycetaceae]AEW98055.1 N-(5-amino-5-carboxypentanoyl)-L-cysteinyl-D-valine synthase [Streptantibioticus cattleyicolor NRRL 8057 = DSM 46488]MYS62449.1 non-ribosomal peptide synthetase [Streptomyces sp. SID5468]CCB78371.1 N-(5-amino-5-carboxypentanoyl)-L-cysteinyl-D-valine synthase [Streptantibioticus cattleyicolor NRRL 8057 = DSM 46488]
MMSARYPRTAADWTARIEGVSGERCDLEMLLKDEWRNRIAVRDDDPGVRATRRRELAIGGPVHQALRRASGDGVSVAAFALATLHSVMRAYGHGNRTVAALVDATGTDDMRRARVLPVIVDHEAQGRLSRAAAVREIDAELRHRDAWTAPDALLQRGLFDMLLVLADREIPPAELPSAPLAVIVRDAADEGCLRWTMAYAGELFEDRTIAGVLDVVREVFGQYVTGPAEPVAGIELASAEQRERLREWNATDGDFPADVRLEDLFTRAARRSPDQQAVVFGDTTLTYRTVDERSDRLARWLIGPEVGVAPQELIGLYLDKSDLGVVATLGIWKAGAAYVPIDPAYPAERVRFTVGDTGLTAVVTNRHHAERLREILGDRHAGVRVIEIETVLARSAADPSPGDLPRPEVSSRHLAYVTYTSGTTGVPKGVPKYHDSVVNSITDLSERYDMRRPGEERVALFASYVFEPHLRQTLIALINSQTLVIVPEDVRLDPDRFPAYIERHRVTYLNATGSVLHHFDLRRCTSLKKLLLVGEELTAAGLRRLRETFSGRIVNEYAFTEAAFVTAVKEFAPGVTERPDRSIGRPVRNVKWYVLSQNLKQLPIGAIGELYIGGCGVAPGYLNRDELTAERFLANPYQSERDKARGMNARLYRTGDLARMLPSGEVEFMGRGDFQLKLNGVRVEPGEIEARATEYPGVRRCVVVAREGTAGTGERHLVGYYVTEPAAEVTEEELLAFLEQRLIRIMVPARMVRMDAIPVNVNGKADWRALPEVDLARPGGAAADGGAAGGVLGRLREIWSAVLGVPAGRIGDGDDFFRLGGQSISCILLVARIRRQLGVFVGVEDVFELRTLEKLAHHLERRERHTPAPDPGPDAVPEPADGEPVRLLAGGLQQGLLYHALKRRHGDDAYVMQSVHRYHCRIDPELMREAWQHARRKYPALRLRFEWDGEPLQVVDNDDKPFDWRYVDLSGTADPGEQDARIRGLQERDRTEPYDPGAGRLFRVYLIKQRADLFSLILSCHHIILDGWSLPVLHDDVHRMYLRLLRGEEIEPAVDGAYLAAQRHWAARRGDHVGYWTRQVERIDERGDFAGLVKEDIRYQVALGEYDHVREHRTRRLALGAETTAALKAVCAAHQVTLHSVLQFVWHQVLHAIGGGNTTVVGTIVSGRDPHVDGIENSVGLFINTLPLIVDHDDQETGSVADALGGIQAAVNTMNARCTVELGRLETGGMKRRLFDTLLVLENYPRLLAEDEERAHRELLRYEKAYDADKVDYPLAVVAREEDDELTVTLWYAGELFDDTTVETLLDVARTLFVQVAEDVTRPVAELELVPAAMIGRFDAWNRTRAAFPADRTLHGIFEEMAAAWPDETAVVYRDTSLTYRQLNERANRLAHHLLSVARLRPGDLVGLVLDKSELMITAILAVWKTGAAYVPVDPGYPDDRISFMLQDTSARLVVTNHVHGDRLRALPDTDGLPVLDVERLPLDEHPAHDPVTAVTATDLAYAIYTSGTTGRPKAVLVEHQGVVNLQVSLAKIFGLDKGAGDEALLSFSNYVFDHFVEQMTDALLNGQKLVVLDDTMRTDAERLYKYINDHDVTYLSGTPSVLSLYDWSTTTSLTRIDAIGEDFTEPVFNKIRGTFPGTIINGYGPTEISITSHKRPYAPGERRSTKSIGHPVANTTAYVLDRHLRRVPVGGMGELYIGGVGVTRGYLNRDELTAERFIANPFQTPREKAAGYNARLYRTGDLVRWLPGGELECLGRTDLQVKIRGQRVELGEVEAALSSYPGVTRALVVAREHHAAGFTAPQKYLVGFYVCDRDLDEHEVKQWMRGKLPEAVVPSRVLRITDIPVTPSGKLDTRRLPETDFASGDGVAYVAPSDDVEARLCGIWSTVLGVPAERVGVRDDFFALGGDSLRAMVLAQAVTTAFGRGLGVATVLQHTTLGAQARHIRQAAARADDEDLRPAAGTGRVPVSPAQERLLFIDEFEGGTAAYNIPFALRIATGDTDRITRALHTLLRRHPALRTLLRTDEDGVRRQHVMPAEEASAGFDVPVRTVDGEAELDERLVEGSGHVFRPAEELPVRAELFRLAGARESTYLGLVFHHTCFDGWSWNTFREELAALLRGVPETQLPPVRGTYAEFAVWQRQHLTGSRTAELTEFWTGALAGYETVRLPLDRPRPARFDYRGREIEFALDEPVTRALRALAGSARVSLYSVLLGAWCLTLHVYTGQDDFVVGTPSANRGRPEFDRTVGFFANLLALRVRVETGATLAEYVRAVGAGVVAAQVHGELPFEQLVKELDPRKDPSRHPVLQVNFTLRKDAGTTDEGSALSDYTPDAGGWTTTKFDLSATLTETAEGLTGNLTYAASLFEDDSAHGFITTFRHVLREFARLSSGGGEQSRLTEVGYVDVTPPSVTGATDGTPVPAAPRTLHEVFAETAAVWPDRTAVVCGDVELTYRQLDERADALAHQLRSVVALRPGELVGLVLDKSELMVVAILAVWKAGAAYLPIDPGYPDDRISFMLQDTGARLVVANHVHGERLRTLPATGGLPVLDVERLPLDGHPASAPVTEVTAADPAYAIYTSGTTGRPKAVLVPHRAVDSFRRQLTGRYFGGPDTSREGVLFLANYVFDFSVEQLALSVLAGHALVVPPVSPADDDGFADYANRAGVTYLSGTPTQIQQLDLARLTGLRCVLVAGEAFHERHFAKIRAEFSGPIVNAYGTTETAVYNTVRRFEPGEPYRNSLGAPLGNTRLYVLGAGMRPLPPGAVGELYLAGECVTDGYLNRPELTRERFLPNPLRTEAERAAGRYPVVYRTGDLVRLTRDGELRYVGRNDAQVKIHGVRVEPGEVESVLAGCPGIGECAVVAAPDERSPDGRRLVAYYVAEPGAAVDEDAVFTALRARLMAAMVPSLLVRLDGPLPMTVNGKLDAKALPAPSGSARRAAYAPPRSRTEARLCRLWGDHLPGDTVGIDDDFFRSGGDSISALHLAGRMQRELGRRVGVKDIFDFPTVRRLADNVLAAPEDGPGTGDAGEAAPEARPVGEAPLLPVQEWFFAKPLTDRAWWNQTFAVRVPPLDVARLREAVTRLIGHHDAFRLRYTTSGTQVTQSYQADDPRTVLHELDVSGLGDEEIRRRLARWQSGFDLAHGPLHSVAYLHGFPDGGARVWFALHHLIVDTVSWHILAQDLEILYHGGRLEEKTSSYRQWAEALRRYVAEEDERRMWAEVTGDLAAGWPEALTPAAGAVTGHQEFALSAAETRTLLTESHWAYDTTMNDLLLTATGYALRSVTGRAAHHVTVEGHGRERFAGAPEVRDTVGWFTTMHPLTVTADPDDIAGSVLATKAAGRRVPHHGIGYGALFGRYGGDRAPLPPVSFNYLGRVSGAAPRARTGWQLDPALCGADVSGRDRGADRSALDVTMWCADGRLVTAVDSRLDPAVTERFTTELRSWLERLTAHTSTVAGEEAPARRTGPLTAPEDGFDPYILIDDGQAERTLFVFPPGEGGAESYLSNIAQRLPGYRLVLFNNVHLHTPMESFEALARYHLDHIRRLQPSGSYSFLGWSFGGVLAVEVSLQLARAGEKIDNLFLIDPYFDVRHASARIGLPADEDILDPINYHYTPDPADLERLGARVGSLVLFKAGEVNDVVRDDRQRRLFAFYQRSSCNGLDALLPAGSIEVRPLPGATHHSWVRDERLVAGICERVAASLSDAWSARR